MAVVTRYFGVEDAGVGDGSSWANRAAMLDSGQWSPVLTGFDFSGSDSLLCLIGPGSYDVSQSLSSSLFANPPSVQNPLILHGCDDAGNPLVPSNPGWVSAQPVDWEEALPVFTTNANFSIINIGNTFGRLLKFYSSGRTSSGGVLPNSLSRDWEWIVVENPTSHENTYGIGVTGYRLRNSCIRMTGDSYNCGLAIGNNGHVKNVRVEGNPLASSGSRIGIISGSTTGLRTISETTAFSHPGGGIIVTSNATGFNQAVERCSVVNCGGNGVELCAAEGQTNHQPVIQCVITGCGGYGIDAQASYVFAIHNRLRDNTSGSFSSFHNYPTDTFNLIAPGSDADEYADPAIGDYRIKYGSALWGQGYGAGDEPAPAGGGIDLPEPIIVGA